MKKRDITIFLIEEILMYNGDQLFDINISRNKVTFEEIQYFII